MKNIFAKNRFNFALLLGLLCALFVSLAQFNLACDDLRTNVLRLHIIANSNSVEDQALKLEIRDRLLAESGSIFEGAEDVHAAIEVAQSELPKLEKLAKDVIFENGFEYSATAKIGDSYFETREYEDFTLPAGYYESLIITVGEGKGKNWWCVIFPEVCLPAATNAELDDVTNEKSAKIAYSKDKYVMRFKLIEVYENIKKSLFKK